MAIIFELISNGWLRKDLATPIPRLYDYNDDYD